MLSVVIPAYNEASNIQQTLQDIVDALQDPASGIQKFEIIVVDDHSNDGLYQKVLAFGQPNVHCISLSRRNGSHIALRAGLRYSQGDAAICISADGQDNPNVLHDMIQNWQNGEQIVWALRTQRSNEPLLQKYFSLVFYSMLKMLTESQDQNIDLSRADFYLLDRQVVDAINDCPERHTSLFGLIAWSGFRQGFVDYERLERRTGKSKWNFRSRLRLAKDWIIAFSGLPLKMVTFIGFSVALLGMLYAVWIFFNALSGHPAHGWSSLMIAILVIGGLQMAIQGIIGEYLWRTLDESRKRPLFFIKKSSLPELPDGNLSFVGASKRHARESRLHQPLG